MNVAQMLSHLQVPMEVAVGRRKLKRTLIGMLFGKIAKKKMAGAEPFSKNLPTDKNFLITDDKNFEAERDKVISLVKAFAEKGPAVLNGDPHPFFGKMSEGEWDTLSWKHLDHHLRQFGV